MVMEDRRGSRGEEEYQQNFRTWELTPTCGLQVLILILIQYRYRNPLCLCLLISDIIVRYTSIYIIWM
jgi:hypothetical protein